MEVRLLGVEPRLLRLQPQQHGYYEGVVDRVEPGTRYLYRLDGRHERPDPASRFQPEGIHGPSQVVATQFVWEDPDWSGIAWKDYIIYELHVGTFTPRGTFDAAIDRLGELRRLGVTALEIMPVAQFPGSRNWGYDGVHPFAVQNTYGGPDGLRRLINACHGEGLAVVLDVVYNHLGPEGNYFGQFGPYFTDRYRTPWGEAINFDGPGSDEVREFFLQNARYWIGECHIDALRLDAVHAIFDQSARPFLAELGETVHRHGESHGRRAYVIAESNLNDMRHVRPPESGGFGFDAQWSDDFHHALHVLLTGEQDGYYGDFGALSDLGKAYSEGFAYTGQPSRFRGHRHGMAPGDCPAEQFVVFAQNHDQIGNRMLGERLSQLVDFESLKLAGAAVLLSPFVPLIFMGEEYGEEAPFQYFISHLDADLVEAVRRGRREEFAEFRWRGEPPDPFDPATLQRCILTDDRWESGRRSTLKRYYAELIRLRKARRALAATSMGTVQATALENERVLVVRTTERGQEAVVLLHFGRDRRSLPATALGAGTWWKRLDSSEPQWDGPGSAVPERIDSQRQATLNLPPRACLLLTQTGAA